MTKYKILEILINNNGNFISGEILSLKLGVSRTAIWKGINSLKEKGYKIEGIRNKGYRLVSDIKDNISEYEIKKRCSFRELGRNIYCFEKLDSTNTYIKENNNFLKHGDIVIADEQMKGRGKFEKVFYSPKESGIYMSIILKKNIFSDSLKLLSIASFISVYNSIRKCTSFSPELEWDSITILGKKICGILIEDNFKNEEEKKKYVVIGIGINVNNLNFPKNLKNKVTSLRIELNKEIDRVELILNIIKEIEEIVCEKRYIFNRKKILDEYIKKVNFINKNVKIEILNRKIIGKVININELGGLIILKENKKIEIVYRGKLKIIKDYEGE